ncbi:MAG: hypothetical protein IJM02_01555 [Clostridia bacterium]|nr:hypothetical protein [Clostridia bacterium]
MKRKTIIIAVCAAVILICAVTGGVVMFGRKQAEPVTAFEKVTLTESTMRGKREYEIINKGESAEVSLYRMYYKDGEEEKRLEKQTDCGTDAVLEILNTCGVTSWDGFHGKHPKNVSDGTMFGFEASVNSGKVITASGSENFPKNYRMLTDWFYETLKDADVSESE